MSNLKCRWDGPLPIESHIEARSGFKTFVILELARIRADRETSVSMIFFPESHCIPIQPQIGKKVQFTPFLLVKELISDDLPMEMAKLKIAVHS